MKITRTIDFGGRGIQQVDFELTREEMDTAWRTVQRESDMDTLTEKIYEVSEENPKRLKGVNVDALVENEGFMDALLGRWNKYNGNGGDPSENLDEALSITLSEFGRKLAQKNRKEKIL